MLWAAPAAELMGVEVTHTCSSRDTLVDVEQRFLTIDDVSERLALSRQAVRSMIKRGDLAALQVGGRGLWRIPEEALDAYIQAGLEHTAQAVAEAATASEPEQS